MAEIGGLTPSALDELKRYGNYITYRLKHNSIAQQIKQAQDFVVGPAMPWDDDESEMGAADAAPLELTSGELFEESVEWGIDSDDEDWVGVTDDAVQVPAVTPSCSPASAPCVVTLTWVSDK